MLHVALYQPEIPPNTGNIIRLCANSGTRLHLIAPLGFALDDKRLRRAGLDYHEFADITLHADYAALRAWAGERRIIACTTKASQHHHETRYRDEDVLLFGPESRGLPDPILAALPDADRVRIPMRPGSRSLNLSNAVAIVLYLAWQQLDFSGALSPRPDSAP